MVRNEDGRKAAGLSLHNSGKGVYIRQPLSFKMGTYYFSGLTAENSPNVLKLTPHISYTL